ncbi:MAG: BACON domain-containing protein [Bacteroidales bacterium]|nr:BACON domain-containing protein [Bacteroidales bacterium]
MKKYLLAIAAGLLLLASCQKAPSLVITSPASIDLSVDGSSGTITFTANRDWSISASDSWVSVSPRSGEASKDPVTVNVSCNANTTYDDRTATVTIKMEDQIQTVTIKQPANLGIVLATQAYELVSDARTLDITVQANVEYKVEITGDWIKQTGTKGLTPTTFTFSVEENTTYDPREGKITIKPQDGSVQEQVISVKQAQKDALIIKDTSFDMPYGGGEIEFKVEANVDFDVKPDVDWIKYVETKALSNSSVRLTVDENPTFEKRKGKIEIKQKNGTLSHTLTVVQQARKPYKYLTFESDDTSTLSMQLQAFNWSYDREKPVLYFSTDAKNWTEWDYSEITITKDHPVFLCGNNPSGLSDSKDHCTFYISGSNVRCSGDIMSLINREDDVTTIPGDYCFYCLFNGCSLLVSAPDLPATTLAKGCYDRMYSYCKGLISAPKLPAVNLAPSCYSEMFMNCESLLVAPDLPATTLAESCYEGMFSACVSLTNAPVLPATTLADHCYSYMFSYCHKLKTPPELPAKSLAPYCYNNMFMYCSSLNQAPSLPATVLAKSCYGGMFDNCEVLSNAPNLPATTMAENCYYEMFRFCKNLVEAPTLPATTLAPYCYCNMFENCYNLKIVPESLPATTLETGCYSGMFRSCRALTSAPVLPAKTLSKEAYASMFAYSYNLRYVTCLATDISAVSCTYNWLKDVASYGIFVKAESMADWELGSIYGVPSGWTIKDYE